MMNATTAKARTRSSKMTPRCAQPLAVARSAHAVRGAADIGAAAGSTFVTIRSKGYDFVRRALRRRAVDVGAPPRIGRNRAALQIRPIPDFEPGRPAHEGAEPFARRRVTADVEVIEVERAAEG